jgi:hypothetical protein
MFVLKSTYINELIKRDALALEQQEMLRQGYLARIGALEAHIDDLRKLVFSPTRADVIPAAHEEADLVITQNEPILPSEDEMRAQDDILREKDRIFSGNYDEST